VAISIIVKEESHEERQRNDVLVSFERSCRKVGYMASPSARRTIYKMGPGLFFHVIVVVFFVFLSSHKVPTSVRGYFKISIASTDVIATARGVTFSEEIGFNIQD